MVFARIINFQKLSFYLDFFPYWLYNKENPFSFFGDFMQYTSYYELIRDYNEDNVISYLGPTVYPSHFHQRSEFTYVLEGTCHAVINNTTYSAEAHDLLFAPDYYPHSYATTLDAKRINIYLLKDYVQFLNQKTFPCLLSDKTYNREKLLPLLSEFQRIYSARGVMPDSTRSLLLQGYSDVLFGTLMERYGNELVPRNKQINTLVEILAYIEDHSAEKLTLESLSNKFGYNKFYFSKFFNSSIGDSLTGYINNARIRNFTKRFQQDTHQNVLNLAVDVGFDSLPSFYRAFHRAYHCTPKEYFEKIKN